MRLHFSRQEFAERQRRACVQMVKDGLDGILVFRQESMYYLTGYETMGYSMFQGMYLGADGTLSLLTRAPDVESARFTSVIKDVRTWVDREGATPAEDLRAMLESHGCRGKRIGVEYHAYGLTTQRGKMVDSAFDGFCTLVDASDLVRLQRLVKSPSELEYIRRSGELTNHCQSVAQKMTVPGASVEEIYGEMLKLIMVGGGDPPASRFPMGAGEEALVSRYHAGHAPVGENDQVQFEPAASYRHYHTGLRFVVLTGRVNPRAQDMFKACDETLSACREALRPGNTVADVFNAFARTFTKCGYEGCFMNSCGYTMGATFPPTWMDWPMCCADNPQVLEPNMVFFLPISLIDRRAGLFMALGETLVVTEEGCEGITCVSRELVVN